MDYQRRRGPTEFQRSQARRHPVRTAIMALIRRHTGRPLQAEALAADLAAEFPAIKPDLVWYHLAVLRDADLIPGG
jgi:Fe2+ or Zn2+ uptake regulation protein